MSGEVKGSSESTNGVFQALLAGNPTARMRKMLSAYWTIGTAWKLGKRGYDTVRSQLIYTVSIWGDDEIYPAVHKWLLDQLPSKRRRAVTAQSGRSRDQEYAEVVPSGWVAPKPEVKLFYDGSREQVVEIEDHRIRVQVEQATVTSGSGREQQDYMRRRERIIFRCYGGWDALGRFTWMRYGDGCRLTVSETQ